MSKSKVSPSEGAVLPDVRRSANRRAEMEFGAFADAYRSDSSKRSSRLGAVALQVSVAVVVFAMILFAAQGLRGSITLVALCVAAVAGLLVLSSTHVALDWERFVVLRNGRFNRLSGPGIFFTIPLLEYSTLRVDQRMRITPFGAEETLTADIVPLDVDAVLSWLIWDPEKACTEVEDVCFAVALAAQTALRDAIGRASASEVVMRRNQLDKEIREAVEGKVSEWGVTVLSVEIRDIIIPQALQDAMSCEAQAERRKNARITLMESERDIAKLLAQAAAVYEQSGIAFELRKMHLLHEDMQDEGKSLVVPTAYTEGFSEKGTASAPGSVPGSEGKPKESSQA